MRNKSKARFGTVDIETTPNESYTWGIYEQDVIKVIREWHMLSFSVKIKGGETIVRGLPDYDLYKKDKRNDRELVKELWGILDGLDIVCGHNIDKFDIRKINARFIYHGLTLPSPYKTIDTLKVARKVLGLNSNKLTDIAQYLGIGQKVETGGFKLWEQCMAGDMKAWAVMKKYNKYDVVLTEKVYLRLRPYMASHPNENLYNGTTFNCPFCFSSHIQKRGFHRTQVGVFQKYQCQDCLAWPVGEKIKQDKVMVK